MAFPANPYADMSQFVPAGPNGIPIPRQFAPTFGINEPIAPIVPPEPIAVPPPPEPLVAPGPVPVPPANTNAAAAFQRGAESVRPGPLNDNTLDPFPAPAAAPAPKTKPRPTDPTGMQVDSLERRGEIAQELGELESQAARERKDVIAGQIVEEGLAEKQRAAVREREQKEIAKSRAEQKSAMDAYVNHKVDQNRAWHNRSTGSKIMGGIGVALSAVGSAFTARSGRAVGPGNAGLDIIMKSIDDDVQLQLADRDRLRDVAGRAKDATSDLLAQFKDRESQHLAMRAAGRERVALRFDEIAANLADPAKKLAAQDSAEKLRGDAGVLMETAQQRAIDNRRADKQVAISAGNLALNRDQFGYQKDKDAADREFDYAKLGLEGAIAKQKAEIDAAKANREITDKQAEKAIGSGYNGNWRGTAPSPAAAERLRPLVSAGAEAARLIDGIKRVRAESGSEWFKTAAARKLKADMGALIVSVKNTAGLGALSGPDMELVERFVGTSDTTETDALNSMVAGLDQARGNLIGKVRNELSAAAVEGADKWSPPDLSRVGMVQTPEEEKRLQAVMKTAPGQSPGLINAPTPQQEAVAKSIGGEAGKQYLKRVQGGYTLDQEAEVNAVANGLKGAQNDAQREQFKARLDAIINSDSTPPGLREYAAQAQQEIGAGTYKLRSTHVPAKGLFDKAARRIQGKGEGIFR